MIFKPFRIGSRPKGPGGLYTRRQILAGSLGGLTVVGSSSFVRARDPIPDSWTLPGESFSNYGQPRSDRSSPIRWISQHPAMPGEGVSWTPLHELEGTVTSTGLHFERHHNGVPKVDPAIWELVIYKVMDSGQVNGGIALNLDDLHRLPMLSRVLFLECGGNSNTLWLPNPVQTAAGYLHGLVSGGEWTGVRLNELLSVAGRVKDETWLIATGLDSAGVSVSLPLSRLPEDTLVALYHNGEPLHSEHGFPARLIIPGWEGITQVKWLHQLLLSPKPQLGRYDTVVYSDLNSDGRFERFSHVMGVKSVVTSPSPGMHLNIKGVYEISGLAWSGNGSIRKVEISVDGVHWEEAVLQTPVLDRALTRFRLLWRWQGQRAVIQSKATDDQGNVQPTRSALLEARGQNHFYHYNAINSWQVNEDGDLSHVYRS